MMMLFVCVSVWIVLNTIYIFASWPMTHWCTELNTICVAGDVSYATFKLNELMACNINNIQQRE